MTNLHLGGARGDLAALRAARFPGSETTVDGTWGFDAPDWSPGARVGVCVGGVGFFSSTASRADPAHLGPLAAGGAVVPVRPALPGWSAMSGLAQAAVPSARTVDCG